MNLHSGTSVCFALLLAAGCTAGGNSPSSLDFRKSPSVAAAEAAPPAEGAAPEAASPRASTAQEEKSRESARAASAGSSPGAPPPSQPAQNGAAGKSDGESFPSPHDLTLPVPEIDDDETAGHARLPLPAGVSPNGFSYDIPIVRNLIVDRWIEYFTGPGRERFAEWLRRGRKYIGPFRKILKEKNLPEDLVYLALIESGFNLRARSRAGAVGPWQFMPGTARLNGLKVNYYLDERRDPHKSTAAAAAYLSKLYAEFGDWHLALAAYNAGERRIHRAIRATGKKNYWAIARTRRLPQETRNYVGKFIAGIIIAKNPRVFGFVASEAEPPLRYEVVTLPRGMSLRTVSRLSGVPLPELAELNAELRRNITPPGKGHKLRLPPGKVPAFLRRLAEAPAAKYPAFGRYRIQPGDTFGAIAKRFGIPLRTLMELNANLDPRRLQVGKAIVLPRPKGAGRNGLASGSNHAETPSHHVVGPGESIWTIAKQYGVKPHDILRLNRLSASALIFPGDRLRIRQ